jgi:hypothetical protein
MDEFEIRRIEFIEKHTRVCPRCKRRKVIHPGDTYCIECELEIEDAELDALVDLYADNLCAIEDEL